MKILLDPGHGGIDSGAPGITVPEKTINLFSSLFLGGYLITQGHEVHYTRGIIAGDTTIHLQARVALEHTIQPDLFLSIHCNGSVSPQAHGFEVFYFSAGKSQAEAIGAVVEKSGIITMRRVERRNFYVLAKTKAPAVLVELGFVSNENDNRMLNTPEMLLPLLWKIAQAIDV